MAGQEFHTVSTFEVKIDNIKADSFVRVTGMALEAEDIASKDDNGKQIVNTPGSTNARDLTLVRRFTGDKSLFEWFQEVKTKGGSAKPRTGSIRLLNTERKQIAQFDFEGAWIKAWQGPDLIKESGANSNPTETVVISVADLKMV